MNRADPATLAAKDADDNTPLHLAVEYKRGREGQPSSIEQIVAKSNKVERDGPRGRDFNLVGRSPYLHHRESVKQVEDKERRKREKQQSG